MRQEIVEYLPWGLSAMSLAMSGLNGNKWRYVWLFGLVIQCAWLLWVFASGLWGFMPLTASLFVVYVRNHFRWKRDAESIATKDQLTAFAESLMAREEYRKELWRGGKLIASVPMSSVADAQAQEPKGVFRSYPESIRPHWPEQQEDRRQPTSWWLKDPWAPDPLSDAEWKGPNPLQAPPQSPERSGP
jgi:hypothetical protein